MLGSSVVKGLIIAMIAFIFVGIGLLVGGPTMLQGFDETINATNASSFTAFQTVGQFGPTIILLGFIIMVGVVAFLGIKISSKR